MSSLCRAVGGNRRHTGRGVGSGGDFVFGTTRYTLRPTSAVGTGLVNIPAGSAAFAAAGLTCIGSIAVTLSVSILGFTAATTKVKNARSERDSARFFYNLCKDMHYTLRHHPQN